jgi:hypothetical protein
MLESRNIITTLTGKTLRASIAKGCPKGGVISPLLQSPVVDKLLWKLNDNDYHSVGYADDIAVLIMESLRMSQVSQTALGTVQQWCDRTNMSINPNETAIRGNNLVYRWFQDK